MTPIALAWLLVFVFSAVGILLWIVARPMAKVAVWWQSLWTRLPDLQWLSTFMYDEKTSVLIIRMVGVAFIVLGIVGAVLAVALPYAPLPAR